MQEQEQMQAGRLKLNRRSTLVLVAFILCGALLSGRLFFLQILQYDKYQSDTIKQYTKETIIQAKRGTIYDRNGKPLAISTTVERVFISPNTIPDLTVASYVEKVVETIRDSEEQKEERTRLLSLFSDPTITVAQDIAKELNSYLGVS